MSTRLLILTLVLATAPSRWAPGAAEKPAQQVPTFGSAITVVALPIFVTDKNDQPVAGLKLEDFEITEDGRGVKIVGFHEVDTRQEAVPGTGPAAPATRRQFLLLFDLSFTNASGLVRARKAAVDFVENRLGPADLAGVATFSINRGMQMLVSFTRDRRQVRAALDELGFSAIERKTDPLNLAYDLSAPFTQPIPTTGRETREDVIEREIQSQKAANVLYNEKVKRLIVGLGQLARALGAVQGRKQVIYLSTGFASANLVGAQGDARRTLNDAVTAGELWNVGSDELFGTAGQMTDMSKAFQGFALADAVVHTVDVSGLVAADVTRQHPQGSPEGDGRESLSAIASGSGGRFYNNANDLAPVLQQILDSTRHFYAIAFEPGPTKGAGKIHKLKVRVKGGAHVAHRNAYVETPPQSPMATRFEAAEALAKGLAGGGIAVEAVALPYRLADGRPVLPVVLEIDGPSLLARGPGEQLPLEIYGYALDAQGHIEDTVSLSVTLDTVKAGARIERRGLILQTAFAVTPGKYTLRFLVRDGATRRRGLESLDVVVPEFAGAQLLLSPPLLMEALSRWVPLTAVARSGVSVENPFRVDIEFFAPSARPRLVNGTPSRFFVLSYEGAGLDPARRVEAAARLTHEGAADVSLEVELQKSVSDASGYRRFVVGVTPERVAPGDYRLVVSLKDAASSAVQETVQEVQVQ